MHKIVVAGDKIILTPRLAELLTSCDCEIVGNTSSVEEAVEMAKRLKPDLILRDMAASGKLEGIDAFGTIQEELDSPVIFLSGYTDESPVERAKPVTPFGYIVKPFRGTEIKAAIEEALTRMDSERQLRGIIEQLQREIDEHKRTEEQSKVSLDEREVLLKEIHHRIKNNLQIVSSLLDMHSLRAYDPQTVGLLKEARAKIHAMAFIHSQLYQSDRLAQVNMDRYVRELVDHLSHVYAIHKESIRFDIENSEVYLTISQAIPCALVLHELISNAFKHAFKGRQKGLIKISMLGSTEDKTLMRLEDDGIGIPEETDIYKTDTMGLKLVRNLVLEQLEGSITVKRDNGTKFFIEFENFK